MQDNSEAVDSLRADMAGHQRRFAPDVTDLDNHTLAADAVMRIERQEAETPAPAPAPASEQPTMPDIGGPQNRSPVWKK